MCQLKLWRMSSSMRLLMSPKNSLEGREFVTIYPIHVCSKSRS